jgi:hypothetical protein
LDTITAAVDALQEINEQRFPFVTFLTPEDEFAEDSRANE